MCRERGRPVEAEGVCWKIDRLAQGRCGPLSGQGKQGTTSSDPYLPKRSSYFLASAAEVQASGLSLAAPFWSFRVLG